MPYTSLHNRFPRHFSHLLAVYFSRKMTLEQTVKDLQTQNAQFQEMFLNLAKGQEELKELVVNGKKKKKTKKPIDILNMGRRFRGPVK